VPVQPLDPTVKVDRKSLPRLPVGTLVEGLGLAGDSLRFRRLLGRGPDGGIVCIRRFGGAVLLEPTEERPGIEGVPGSVLCKPVAWGAAGAEELLRDGEVDVVLSSDCVNEPLYGDAWEDLADCMVALSGPRTVVLISVLRRLQDGIDSFLEYLTRRMVVQEAYRKALCGTEVIVYRARRRTRAEGFTDLLNGKALEARAAARAANRRASDAPPSAEE